MDHFIALIGGYGLGFRSGAVLRRSTGTIIVILHEYSIMTVVREGIYAGTNHAVNTWQLRWFRCTTSYPYSTATHRCSSRTRFRTLEHITAPRHSPNLETPDVGQHSKVL